MLMDSHSSQQHAGLQHAVRWPQLNVTRPFGSKRSFLSYKVAVLELCGLSMARFGEISQFWQILKKFGGIFGFDEVTRLGLLKRDWFIMRHRKLWFISKNSVLFNLSALFTYSIWSHWFRIYRCLLIRYKILKLSFFRPVLSPLSDV